MNLCVVPGPPVRCARVRLSYARTQFPPYVFEGSRGNQYENNQLKGDHKLRPRFIDSSIYGVESRRVTAAIKGYRQASRPPLTPFAKNSVGASSIVAPADLRHRRELYERFA